MCAQNFFVESSLHVCFCSYQTYSVWIINKHAAYLFVYDVDDLLNSYQICNFLQAKTSCLYTWWMKSLKIYDSDYT